MKHELKLYGAEWCGTCRFIKKKLEDNNIHFEYVDVDKNMEEADALGINELPTILAYKKDKEDSRWTPTDGDVISWTKFLEW